MQRATDAIARDTAGFEARCALNEACHWAKLNADAAALERAGVPRECLLVLCLLRGTEQAVAPPCFIDERALLARLVGATGAHGASALAGDAHHFRVLDVRDDAALAPHLSDALALACLQREARHRLAIGAACAALEARGVPRAQLRVTCGALQARFAPDDAGALWRTMRLARLVGDACRFDVVCGQ